MAAVRDKAREPGDQDLCVLRTVSKVVQRRIWGLRKVKRGWVRGKERGQKPRLHTLIVQKRES